MKSPIFRISIYLTVFTSSMAIMFLQLVAGRVIAQYLGQSLFTWASIIATTLAGIAIGNQLGGILADKYKNIKTIPVLFLLSAFFIVSIIFINHLLGNLSPLQNLSWQWRILCHISLLLFIPFMMLGTISPVLTRLLITVSPSMGTSVGIFFAFSLLGSLIGTFLTGYILLAYFAYTTLLLLSASLLLIIAIAYFLGSFAFRSYHPMEENQNVGIDTKQTQAPIYQSFPKLLIISFWAGAGIMIIEIVSARLLARNFGNSLYTWTTIIGVVLACLSVGGYLGGYLSQRFNPQKVTAFFLCIASLSTLLIPLANLLLPWTPFLWRFSWPLQILIHSLIAFGPTCLAFGTLSPLLVRMIPPARDGNIMGKKIGMLYAMNAIGGILGVIATGFYTIAHWGSPLTITLTATLSTLLFLWISQKNLYAISYTILVLILLISAIAPAPPWDSLATQLALKPYHAPNILYEKESHYNYILVRVPDPERPYILDLVLDKMIHNRKNMKEPDKLTAPYEYIFHSIINYYQKEKNINQKLVIGGGAYTFCHFLEQECPSCHIEVAEIDPEVTKVAFDIFGLPKDTHLKIYHQDGRNRVEDLFREKQKQNKNISFDCIINDSFSDYSVPFHLTTKEFVEKIHYLLSPEGIYMTNVIDCLTFGYFLSAMYATYSTIFPYLYIFHTIDDPTARDTFILVSANKPLSPQSIVNQVQEQFNTPIYFLSDEKIKDLLSRTKPPILTDQFAPVENLLAPMVTFTEDTPYLRRLTRATQMINKKELNPAIDQILKILDERPNLNGAYLVLIDTLIQAKRYSEAVVWAKKLLQRLPNDAKTYSLLGTAYAHLGNTQPAIEAWEQALQKDPHLHNIKVNLSTLLIQQKQFDKAEILIKEILDSEPSLKPSALINYASLRFAQGRFNESLQYLQQAEQLQPQNYAIKEQMAVVYYSAGDITHARQLAIECQKANHPINPEFLKLLNLQNE